jgi:hypothetical protein
MSVILVCARVCAALRLRSDGSSISVGMIALLRSDLPFPNAPAVRREAEEDWGR